MKNHISLSSVLPGLGAVLLAFIIAASFALGASLAPSMDKTIYSSSVPQAEPATQSAMSLSAENDVIASFEQTLIDIYKNTVPSVVNIRVRQKAAQSSQNPYQHREGSGFVWDNEGHIVTSYHVVAEATRIDINFADGRNVEARVLGTDPGVDLAVLKVNLPSSDLHPLPLADSGTLQPGQLAIAIGNPFGQEFTMTSGIVSAVSRTISCDNGSLSIPDIIQTDAPINPGNSGGPLLNHTGEVIGINTQLISSNGVNTGIGFAIPVNIAKQIVPILIKGNTLEYAWLGITGMTLTPDMVHHIKFPVNVQGVLVLDVIDDSPANVSGLHGCKKIPQIEGKEYQLGADVIVAVNEQPIQEVDELNAYLIKEARPGDEVTLDIIRANGEPERIIVTLGVRPQFNTVNRAF